MSQPIGPSQPTIGRIVHVYLSPITVPAIVTAILSSDGDIACTAFVPYDHGTKVLHLVPHDEGGRTGTWHWPKVV